MRVSELCGDELFFYYTAWAYEGMRIGIHADDQHLLWKQLCLYRNRIQSDRVDEINALAKKNVKIARKRRPIIYKGIFYDYESRSPQEIFLFKSLGMEKYL